MNPLSLKVRGVTMTPWRLGGGLVIFSMSPFDGLLDLRGPLVIIALFNSHHGSGKLDRLFSIFEEATDECGVSIEVVQLWNDRLKDWLARRGYTIASEAERGIFATRPARVLALPL